MLDRLADLFNASAISATKPTSLLVHSVVVVQEGQKLRRTLAGRLLRARQLLMSLGRPGRRLEQQVKKWL